MRYPILLLLALLPVLAGCGPGSIVGAGATVGVAAAQDRGVGGAIRDNVIAAKINDAWFKYDLETFAKLNLTINEGRVLVTGVVQKPEGRVEAIRLVWQVEGVKEVINEIRVAGSGGISGFARDTWITTRLRTSLTFDRNIYSINYSIDTVQGIVYLMGVARNQAELNRVIGIARTIPDVKQVVSYVKLSSKVQAMPQPVNDDISSSPPRPPEDGSYQPETYQSQGGPTSLVPEPVQQEQLNSGY